MNAATTESGPEWMTLKECAAWLRLPMRKVSRMTKGRRPLLPACWVNQRVVRFHRPTVIAALASTDRFGEAPKTADRRGRRTTSLLT